MLRLAIAAALACGLPASALAQFNVIEAEEAVDPGDDGTGFRFETNSKLQDSLADFRRHADRGLAEKAIEVLGELNERVASDEFQDAASLLQTEEGLLLPAEEQVWRLQAEMPAEVRDAFRIFEDAKARKAFDEATAGDISPDERLARLEDVRRRFFVSSVGDDASNLLGDLFVRRGEPDRASRMYRDVLDYHPDSELSAAWLLFKIGLAERRAGNDAKAARAAATLRDLHPGVRVTFAGREVVAAEELGRLLSKADAPDESKDVTEDDAPPEAAGFAIAWRHTYLTETEHQTLVRSDQRYYFKGAAHFLPPVAVDRESGRLAYNFYGSVSAVDLNTGKLLWREGTPAESIQMMSGNMYGLTVDAYGLSAGNGLFVSRAVPPDRFNYYRVGPELTAFAVDKGKERWTTGSGDGYGQSEWYHVGTPYIEPESGEYEGRVYIVATKSEGASEAYLKIHDGRKTLREIKLGRYRDVETENYQGRRLPSPIIRPYGDGSLLIFLDEGLLLSISRADNAVEWGVRLKTPPRVDVGRGNQTRTVATTLHPKSSLRIDGPVAFLKDGGRGSVAAVDLQSRRHLWQRPTDGDSEIVAVDDERVYVLGEELLALSREDGSLVWSVPLPLNNGGLSAVLMGESIAVFTDRGLYRVGRRDGSIVEIHRDIEPESGGGRVLMAGGRLVTVSERQITAYDIQTEAGDE